MPDENNKGFLPKWTYYILALILIMCSIFIILKDINIYFGITAFIFIVGLLYLLFALPLFFTSKISDWSLILGSIGYIFSIILGYLALDKTGMEVLGYLITLGFLLIFVIISFVLLIISVIKNFKSKP